MVIWFKFIFVHFFSFFLGQQCSFVVRISFCRWASGDVKKKYACQRGSRNFKEVSFLVFSNASNDEIHSLIGTSKIPKESLAEGKGGRWWAVLTMQTQVPPEPSFHLVEMSFPSSQRSLFGWNIKEKAEGLLAVTQPQVDLTYTRSEVYQEKRERVRSNHLI